MLLFMLATAMVSIVTTRPDVEACSGAATLSPSFACQVWTMLPARYACEIITIEHCMDVKLKLKHTIEMNHEA